MKYDIIVIGAGAAGLMAMKDLLQAGYSICLLEAGTAAGGRIATVKEDGFHQPVETGAEFIHGKLPLTLALLDEAKINYVPVEGKMMTVQNGQWKKSQEHDKHWDVFMRQLGKVKKDISIAVFLQKYFSGEEYASLRNAVQHYSEGFDLADITKASAMAAYREWNDEGDTQYRLPGGYMQLIDYLFDQCNRQNTVVHFNTRATRIKYNKGSVTAYTHDNRSFEGAVLIITMSAGMLQSGSVEFLPILDRRYANAIQQLGFGTVIKIMMEFKNPFWKDHADDIGFILSDEIIRTWWTQLSIENNLLTGWLGGPSALDKSGDTEEVLLGAALASLSAIFHLSLAALQQALIHYKVSRWHNHPFIKGGYSYNTVDSTNAKKILSHPVQDTIFFAGEALYKGQSQGTVEAALQSGREVAEKIKSYS